MPRTAFRALFIVVFAGAMAASAFAGEARNITFVLKNLINPYCVRQQDGAVQAGKDLGVNLTVLSPLVADNNEEMMQLIEQTVASGECDALVLYPSDSVGIVPAVQTTHEAGIPVVLVGTGIFSDEVIWKTYIQADNTRVGYSVGKALGEKMGGKGKAILIEGVLGTQSHMQRLEGARDGLTSFPGVEIVASQPANMNRAMAMEVLQNLLQAHPDVNAVCAMNDEMALGCIEAIDAAGLTGKILVSGCDANKDALTAIRNGTLTMTCDIVPFVQGYTAVESAVRVLNGETLPQTITVDTKIVDASNIGDYIP